MYRTVGSLKPAVLQQDELTILWYKRLWRQKFRSHKILIHSRLKYLRSFWNDIEVLKGQVLLFTTTVNGFSLLHGMYFTPEVFSPTKGTVLRPIPTITCNEYRPYQDPKQCNSKFYFACVLQTNRKHHLTPKSCNTQNGRFTICWSRVYQTGATTTKYIVSLMDSKLLNGKSMQYRGQLPQCTRRDSKVEPSGACQGAFSQNTWRVFDVFTDVIDTRYPRATKYAEGIEKE